MFINKHTKLMRVDQGYVVYAPSTRNGLYATLVTEQVFQIVEKLLGEVETPTIRPDLARYLYGIGVLSLDETPANDAPSFDLALPDIRFDDFTIFDDGSILIRNAVDGDTREAMSRYYAALNDAGWVMRTGAQVKGRLQVSRMGYFESWHDSLTAFINQLRFGFFKNSYSHWVHYKPGCHLAPHKDNNSAYGTMAKDLTCSMIVKHEGALASSWPIYVEGVSHVLNEGDIFIFEGKTKTHWRDPLPDQQSCNCLLFFFKDESNEPMKESE